MKPLLTIASFLLLTYANAQVQTVAPAAAPVDLHLVGFHIENDGKQRTTSMLVAICGGLIGAAAIASNPEKNGAAGAAIAGASGLISIYLQFNAAGHAKKAGRILQGKPL